MDGGDPRIAADLLVREFGSAAAALAASQDRQLTALKGDLDALRRLGGFRTAMLHVLRSDIVGRPLLSSWSELTDYLRAHLAFSPLEHLLALHLGPTLLLLKEQIVSIGDGMHTPVGLRSTIAASLACGASGLILVHNHPSGNIEPSADDVLQTSRLKAVADPLGIELIDHLIVAGSRMFSFRRAGLLR